MRLPRLVSWVLIPVVVALLLLFSSGGEPVTGGAPDAPASSPDVKATAPAPLRTPRVIPAAAAAPTTSRAEAEREIERRLWERRVERARHTLDAYLEATRYPPESRPISEHPDRVRPDSPERNLPLDPSGDGEVRLMLRQEKVFVAGQESVGFFVRCEDREGQPRPCEIVSAFAHEAPHRAAANELVAVPLAFSDDGSGTLVARFRPATDGFPLYEGTLRIDIKVRSGAVEGGALFDVIFTPSPPAAFTGTVREAMQDGSLDLFVGMQVRKAGRYVVTGRVDDATGTPFALLTFNEELNEGRQEARLTLFGRLVLDQHPVPPFTLRDVEGFLLKESGDPDRALMSALPGPVHTTRIRPESEFSSAEWQSEERERHVKEFTRDLDQARSKVADLAAQP